MAITREPLLDFGSFMIRRVVMNEEHFLSAVSLRHALKKHHIALAFEHLAMGVVEPRPVEINRPEDLLRMALTSGRN